MTGISNIGHDDRVVSVVKHNKNSDVPVSTTLLKALSDVDGYEPCSYEPLYDVVDPDCLDGLFRPVGDDAHRMDGRVSFPFAGYHVTVESDGTLTIRTQR